MRGDNDAVGMGIVSLCLYPVCTHTRKECMEDYLQSNKISKVVGRHVCKYTFQLESFDLGRLFLHDTQILKTDCCRLWLQINWTSLKNN